MRFLALCSTPATLEDLGFSVGVMSLSWFVPIIALGTHISPLHDLAIQRCFQGSWKEHACIGLGRNKWHFSGFKGAHTPAGYVPLRIIDYGNYWDRNERVRNKITVFT